MCSLGHFNRITASIAMLLMVALTSIAAQDLTIFSFWRNNTDHYLSAHLNFYEAVWGARHFWLNIALSDADYHAPLAKRGCAKKTERRLELKRSASIQQFECNSTRVTVVAYVADSTVSASVWNNQKHVLMGLYRPLTHFVLPVDHDEFITPANGDAAAALHAGTFKYHMVEIVPVAGARNWSAPMSWVATPYYYRAVCANMSDGYALDGIMPTTKLTPNKHVGPFPEFEHLRNCTSCLRQHNIMWHVAIPSEEYFVFKKLWDQTTLHPGKSGVPWMGPSMRAAKTRKFFRCAFNPSAHGFEVFTYSDLVQYFR